MTDAAEQLAKALGAVRSGRQWKCRCIAHENKNPSMIIFEGRTGAVQVRCLAGCEPQDIIAVLRSRGLWHSEEHGRTPTHKKCVSHETDNRREQQLRVLARCLFDDAKPDLRGTLAERYFDSRDLWSVARDIEDIRFHPRCPRAGGEQPAVVIAMRSLASRAMTAVQRIFLTRQGHKDGAMMLGTAGGAAMQLQPRGRELHICEGLETGLAIIAMDHAPVWALGSTSNTQTFPVLDDVERLVIWPDNDQHRKVGAKIVQAGVKAAGLCEDRWFKAGKEVEIYLPKIDCEDAADVWRKRCARY
jgi:putative DNA primase/helicase